MKSQEIYLDSHATTPVDQDVLTRMLPFFTEHYGNGNHRAGWKTNAAMAAARFHVSALIGARPTEMIFTSGATEAINLALLGLARSEGKSRRHIITQQTEHSAVLQCVEALREEGFRISTLAVDAVGRIDLEELRAEISADTLLVAIMLANNEIGTIQPVKEIGAICREAGAKFFCDITQGLGWHPIQVDELNIDLAAMSSHKIYGPRGVGGLFVRRSRPKLDLRPVLYGGGQERGIRPGTANIPGIVGFGRACELQYDNRTTNTEHIRILRDRLQTHLFSAIEGIQLNGCPNHRHPGNLNLSIPGLTGEDLMGALPRIIFSTGSACTSASAKPSHVLSALGIPKVRLQSSFRLGVGKFNTETEIDYVAEKIIAEVKRLQTRRALRYRRNTLHDYSSIRC